MKRSKSINDLTKNDSKVLGTNTTRKLDKLSSKNYFNTSLYKTILSNWTPISNRASNKTIYSERCELIYNWFDIWSDQQRNNFLNKLFIRCNKEQFQFVHEYFDKKVPLSRVDFTRILPRNISIKIFSYLDPRSLSRSSQVSWHWKFLTEQDELWIPRCRSFGWYLPYAPNESEFGAWKRHYIGNAISVEMSVGQIKGSLWRRFAITNSYEPDSKKNESKHGTLTHLQEVEKSEILNSRQPWMPTNGFPNDLELSRKALFAGLNPNEPQLQDKLDGFNFLNKYGQVDKKQVDKFHSKSTNLDYNSNELKKKKVYLSKVISWEESRYTELVEGFKMNGLPKGPDIVKCGDHEQLPWQKSTLKNINQLHSLVNGYTGWTNPRVIFISSKLPASEMLLDSVIFGVIPIIYDYDASTIRTLIYDLESTLKGRLARSIGLFGHHNSENEMWIVRDQCLSLKHLDDSEIKHFTECLSRNTLPKEQKGHIDLFTSFGAYASGYEMLVKINERSGSNFTAPNTAIGQFNFIVGSWVWQPEENIHPCLAYFENNKLNSWMEFAEVLSEIVVDITCYFKEKYPEIDDFLIKQLTGKIIREIALKNSNLNMTEITNEIINPLISFNNQKPLQRLYEHLSSLILQENSINAKTEMSSPINEKLSTIENMTKFQSKPYLRSSIAKEILLNEKRYFQIIKAARDFYYDPLRRALLSNRNILGMENIGTIFGDLITFIEPSESFISMLQIRIDLWNTNQVIGDLLDKYTSDLLMIFKSFFLSYQNSLKTIDRCRETNSKFRGFLERHDNQPESGMISLKEIFLKPFNRINEYKSLVHWFLSETPTDHIDALKLKCSLSNLAKINKIIIQEKSRIRNEEQFQHIQELINHCPILIESGRFFVAMERLCLYTPPINTDSYDPDLKCYQYIEDCGCFLFNDSLILTRIVTESVPFQRGDKNKHFFEHALLLSKVSIFDIPDKQGLRHAIQLRCGKRLWLLGFYSIIRKYHFTAILRKYIQSSVDLY